jgi:uncharacterized membrane protein YfcA
MHIDLLSILLLLIAGFASGLFVSICSGTAAAYMIPFLTIFLGKSVYKTIGTSLFVDSIISLTAGLVFLRNGNTRLKEVILIILLTSIGAVTGSFFTSRAPETGLNIYFGIILFLFGINLLYNGVQKNVDFIKSKYSFSFFKKYKTPVFIVGGFFVGFMSGLTGFGGAGFIAIALFFILDYDIHTAIGTSLLIMFFLAASGSFSHFLRGEFIVDAALISGSSAVFGAIIGSLYANRIDQEKLGRVIGLIVLILGIVIFARVFI